MYNNNNKTVPGNDAMKYDTQKNDTIRNIPVQWGLYNLSLSIHSYIHIINTIHIYLRKKKPSSSYKKLSSGITSSGAFALHTGRMMM
jgi:hypothetical protein